MLCGERLGSQQMLLMDSVLGCHPLPQELGTRSYRLSCNASVLSCWGKSGAGSLMGPPASTENSRGKPWPSNPFLLPGTTLASEGSVQEGPAQTKRKQWTALTELGHQFIQMMQRIFMPEGRRRVCGADGELCGHRGKQDGAQ